MSSLMPQIMTLSVYCADILAIQIILLSLRDHQQLPDRTFLLLCQLFLPVDLTHEHVHGKGDRIDCMKLLKFISAGVKADNQNDGQCIH